MSPHSGGRWEKYGLLFALIVQIAILVLVYLFGNIQLGRYYDLSQLHTRMYHAKALPS